MGKRRDHRLSEVDAVRLEVSAANETRGWNVVTLVTPPTLAEEPPWRPSTMPAYAMISGVMAMMPLKRLRRVLRGLHDESVARPWDSGVFAAWSYTRELYFARLGAKQRRTR